jgi:hypothetical protein
MQEAEVTTIFGLDIGNSDSSLARMRGNGIAVNSIPSFVGYGKQDRRQRMRSAQEQATSNRGDDDKDYVLEYDGAIDFVGQLAIEQTKRSSSGRDDRSRYWNVLYRKLMLTLIGSSVQQNEVEGCVVTGLPVEVWNAQNARAVRENIKGEHCFRLNGRERVFICHGALVVMEGAAVGLTKGRQRGKFGVIDIGGRTTELYVANARGPLFESCAGHPLGVEDIGDRLSDWFALTYFRPLSESEKRNVLHTFVDGTDHDPIFARLVDDNPINLHPKTAEFAGAVGSEIAEFVRRTWATSETGGVGDDLSSIDLVGGGARYFRSHIASVTRINKVSVTPELENVRSYLQLGMALPVEAWAKL